MLVELATNAREPQHVNGLVGEQARNAVLEMAFAADTALRSSFAKLEAIPSR